MYKQLRYWAATFVLLQAAMDQADTQACQNHHFGVCFPSPHFQVSANDRKQVKKSVQNLDHQAMHIIVWFDFFQTN